MIDEPGISRDCCLHYRDAHGTRSGCHRRGGGCSLHQRLAQRLDRFAKTPSRQSLADKRNKALVPQIVYRRSPLRDLVHITLERTDKKHPAALDMLHPICGQLLFCFGFKTLCEQGQGNTSNCGALLRRWCADNTSKLLAVCVLNVPTGVSI